MEKVIIIGASSGIGREVALLYSETEARIGIMGRRENKLKELASSAPDKFIAKACDISDTTSTEHALTELTEKLGGADTIIVSAGTGELNDALEYGPEARTIATNIVGWTYIIDWSVRHFIKQGYGHLAVITSVGGLRGNGTAPAYNASKAYQINYTEGIRQKIFKLKLPIYITDIRPGFVDTAMAKGEGLFWIAPVETAGKQIFRAVKNKKKTIYITKRWKLIAFILKAVPSFLYCRI